MYMPNMSASSISSTAASFTVEEEGNNINGNGNEYENCPDECLYFVVDIDRAVPLEYALPLYGFLMPVLVLFTTAINSFCILVLSQKHLRTPTNFVLLSMALADLLTGLSSVPWFLFYYTLRGYQLQGREGLPSFWCRVQPLLSQIVPTIWHTSAIWLGVFLAVQRYIYVCVPSQVHRFCTPERTRKAVAAIVLCSVLTELPELFGKWMERVDVGPERTQCLLRYSQWVRHGIGVDLFFSLHYWFRVALVHALPCLLLLVFTLALTRTIRQAQLRRRSWTTTTAVATNGVGIVGMGIGGGGGDGGCCEEERNNGSNNSLADRCSPRLLSPPPEEAFHGSSMNSSTANGGVEEGPMRKSASWGGPSPVPSLTTAMMASGNGGGGGGGGMGGGRSLDSTNRMLAAICSVFLLIELPAAFIFTLHLLIATGIASNTSNTYRVLNVTLIIRNLLIVFTSPLQFGIYCSMSEQFRLTVRQLFSSRPLFVAQAQPSNYHGGKRYSLILVDVELLRRQQQQQAAHQQQAVQQQQRNQEEQHQQRQKGPAQAFEFSLNRRRHLSLQTPRHQKVSRVGSQQQQQQHKVAGARTAHRKRSAPAGHQLQQQQQQQQAQLVNENKSWLELEEAEEEDDGGGAEAKSTNNQQKKKLLGHSRRESSSGDCSRRGGCAAALFTSSATAPEDSSAALQQRPPLVVIVVDEEEEEEGNEEEGEEKGSEDNREEEDGNQKQKVSSRGQQQQNHRIPAAGPKGGKLSREKPSKYNQQQSPPGQQPKPNQPQKHQHPGASASSTSASPSAAGVVRV